MMNPARMSFMIQDLDRRLKALEAKAGVRPGGDVRGERPQAEVEQQQEAERLREERKPKAPSMSAEPPPAPEAPPPSSDAVEAPAGITTEG